MAAEAETEERSSCSTSNTSIVSPRCSSCTTPFPFLPLPPPPATDEDSRDDENTHDNNDDDDDDESSFESSVDMMMTRYLLNDNGKLI